ncbi:hypothetical protein ASZ90_017931 [hydrocarbon metagenome]|uniref:Putative Flp pilus-assembly TadG-like N-terminal domain-containing protein n=1 Tax=hydrocarbon metagenome TaxID=938273 RepID=A0A0W8E7P3_9ZZZZ
MRNLLNKIVREDSGAIMVMVALGLVAMIGCMALVIDAGAGYAAGMKASNAADAAVLAGVQELPDDPDDALVKAQNYIQLNGVDLADVTFSISEDHKSITGDVNKEQDMYFARIFGINTKNLKAHAKAKVGPATKLGEGTGVVPIGVLQDEIIYDKPMTLKEGGGEGEQGWYGCLNLNSITDDHGGSDVYEHFLTYGYDGDGYIGYGTLILEENGNMSGGTGDGIGYRLQKCQDECDRVCTAEDYDPECPRLVIVPVGKMIDKKNFQVESFVAFFLSNEPGNGNESIITGQFIKPVNIPGAEVDDTIKDNGVYARVLCE